MTLLCLCMFLMLSEFPGKPFFHELTGGTQVTGLSKDGSTVVGVASGANGTKSIFKWTLDDGMKDLAGGSGADGNPQVCANGSVLVATAGSGVPDDKKNTAAVWRDGTFVPLNGTARPSAVYGISADGQLAVGNSALADGSLATAVGAMWHTDGSGATLLNSTVISPDGRIRYCRANAVSNGGSVAAGYQDSANGYRAGAIWRDGQQTIVTNKSGAPVGEVLGMNAAGTQFVGAGGWRLSHDGTAEIIDGAADAFAVSDDGSLVGGSVGDGFMRTGFLWSHNQGLRPVLAVFQQRGVPLPANISETDLGSVTAISGDGLTVAGWGMKLGVGPTGWVARMADAYDTLLV